jgi:hypothetical protein
MSNTTFVQSTIPVIRPIAPTARVLAAIKPQKFKLIRPDFSVLLPIVGIILLVVGFGVAAAPLIMHDIPMLLN